MNEAFNLRHELLAKELNPSITSWRQRVDHNLQFFTREYIVEENISRYSYGLKRDHFGLPNQIYSIGYEADGDIKRSFEKGDGIRARAECIGFDYIEDRVFAGAANKDFFIWHSPPGRAEDGFGNHNFTFIGQVLEEKVEMVAYRNFVGAKEASRFLNQFLPEEKRLQEAPSDLEFLMNPVFIRGGERFITHHDIIRAFDEKGNNKENSCRWLLDALQPLRNDVLEALEKGNLYEAELSKIAHDNFALGLLSGEIKAEVLSKPEYDRQKRKLIAQGAPILRGSCGFSGQKIGGEAMTWSGAQEQFFECPRCHGQIESGKGIEVCPHCGMRKEDCAEACG